MKNKVIDDVVEACDKNYAMILNKNLVKIMIDNVAEQFPGVVEDLIPSRISVFQIEQELKQLVKDGESIRDMIGILEAMEMKLENMKPVMKASICNGEQIAGFKDIHTGKLEEEMHGQE